MSVLDELRHTVSELEFLGRIRNKLVHVRLIHESDEETFDRILELATRRICKECRGYGRSASGIQCEGCSGAGVLPVSTVAEGHYP